jgi:Na+/glutamate symporter
VKIAQITNAGLWTIGLLVAVLWGFIVADRLIRRRANLEVAQTMQELKSLQIRNHRTYPQPKVGESPSVTL